MAAPSAGETVPNLFGGNELTSEEARLAGNIAS